MQQFEAIVTHRDTIGPAWWQLRLDVPGLSGHITPGQFFLARCNGCYLRRPIFPQQLSPGQLSLLLRPTTDRGQAWLAARQPRNSLNLLGPFGSGFQLSQPPGNLLLVSNSQNLSPLLGLIDPALTAGAAVTLLLGGNRAATIYPAARLPAAVEVQVATGNGSQGQPGTVTNLLAPLLGWADAVCAVGSIPLYRTLQICTQQVRLGSPANFLWGLVMPGFLPCGVGACFGCTVFTQTGPKLACTTGPVLDLMSLALEHGL